jgi:hypothetical protein
MQPLEGHRSFRRIVRADCVIAEDGNSGETIPGELPPIMPRHKESAFHRGREEPPHHRAHPFFTAAK